MAPQREEDWSDSDEESSSDIETSVLLGVPDGPVDEPNDLKDAAVSRIGGHPVGRIYICEACFLLIKLSAYEYMNEYSQMSIKSANYNFWCRHFYCQKNLRSLRPSAKTAHTLWSFWLRYFVHSKRVLWIEFCISGAVLGENVSVRRERKTFSYPNGHFVIV